MRLREYDMSKTLSIAEICNQFVNDSFNSAMTRGKDVNDSPVVIKLGNQNYSIVGLDLVDVNRNGKQVYVLRAAATK